MIRAHSRRAARNLATSSRKLLCALKKKRQPPGEGVDIQPGLDRAPRVLDAVGQREGHLLHRAAARLADVVAADADHVPLRQHLAAVAEAVDGEHHARLGREDICPARHVFLEDVVLDRAAQRCSGATPCSSRHQLVHPEQDDRRGVDRHARRHLVQRDAVEQRAHVVQRVDRHADLAHLAQRHRVQRVIAHLRRQVEGHATGRSDRCSAGSGSARSWPGLCRTRRTGASSRSGRGTSSAARRG